MKSSARAMSVTVAMLISLGLAGCGSDSTSEASATPSGTPAVCSSVDALKSSVADLTNVDLTKGALSTVQDKLEQVQADSTAAVGDARSEYATEAEAVKAATRSLGASLEAAAATPTQRTLTAVRTAVQTLGTALAALDNAVRGTC